MKQINLSLCVAVILAISVLPAHAGKDLNQSELQEVGHGEELLITPDLEDAVRIGSKNVWSHWIEKKDATFIKVHFRNFNLRSGDQLIVRSLSGRVVEILEGRGPRNLGSFWGLSGKGSGMLLELNFSASYAKVPFEIDQVILGDTDLFSRPSGTNRSICQPPDFEDVICYESDPGIWANVTASVGVMTVGSSPTSGLWCSGSNVSPRNYLMTNWHCIPDYSPCSNAEFVFKYYHTSCGGTETTTDWESFRCDEILVESEFGSCEPDTAHLDFTLSSVIGNPAASYGNVQPDAVPLTDGEGIYIIQHPDGRPHEITQGSGSLVDVDGHTLRYYDTLDTEGGSSGSPIFRASDHKMVGLHHCGGCDTAGERNRGMLMSDIYPLIESYLCTQDITLMTAGWENLSEVAGNGDDNIDPGESWGFTPRVSNTACTAEASNAVADLIGDPSSAALLSIDGSPAAFGNIPAGQSAPAASAVVFQVDPAVSCSEEVKINLENLSATGVGPFNDVPSYFKHLLGELVTTTLMSEDFSGGIPATWTVIHHGTASNTAETWTTTNPGSRSLPLTEPFAIVDSDAAGSDATHDEEMITATVDCTGFSHVELQFSHDFNYYSSGGSEKADVDIRSSATGGAWVNIASYSTADTAGTVHLDITTQAAADVEIRFHYYDANYDYWWAVDDIYLLGDNGRLCRTYSPEMIFNDGFESANTSRWDFASGS